MVRSGVVELGSQSNSRAPFGLPLHEFVTSPP
jgi:hypothetical protein